MDDIEVERNLKAVGKECFVRYYELFRDNSITNELFLVDHLVKNGQYKGKPYTEAGAKIRVSFAKRIFIAGREIDALRLCARARISFEFTNKAKVIIAQTGP